MSDLNIAIEPEVPFWGPIDPDKIDAAFPKENYREGQREAIEYAVKAYNDGCKLVVVEGPTGSGKSSIAMTLANLVRDSYYLTVTKILQDQLTNDFGDQIVELKGRNAYPCTLWDRLGDKLVKRKLMTNEKLRLLKAKHSDCGNGFCKTRFNGGGKLGKSSKHRCQSCFTVDGPRGDGKVSGILPVLPDGANYSGCPYYEQVYTAIDSPRVTMNFSSFLYQTRMTKRFNAPRELLIVDEAHNLEQSMLGFVEVTIHDLELQDHGIFIPSFDEASQYYAWFKDAGLISLIKGIIKEAFENEDGKKADNLTKLLDKYSIFEKSIDEGVEWVATYERKKSGNKNFRSVSLKPVFVRSFTRPLLLDYADKAFLTSATILDVNVLCKSLGFEKSEVAAYRMKNRFPVKNRPIYLETVAKMTGGKRKMHEWGPKMVAKVNQLCKKHEGEKGIIHTHNFAIMNWLLENCDDEVVARLMHQREDAYNGNKAKLLEAHAKTDDGIIIAPAMHEGIDLADDLSRFQIICKVPYANFFDDKQLGRRVDLDPKYYTWMTALKIVQSYGRSIRSPDDYANTYIIDESIHRFMRDARKMLPKWFKEAIHEQEDG